MKADIFNNLLKTGTALSANDMAADDKKNLFAYMVKNGSSAAFAYDRFFREGFALWELRGIDDIKQEFLNDYRLELLTGEPVDPQPDGSEVTCDNGDRGYAAVLAIAGDEPGGFYRAISHVRGLANRLKERMAQMGMCETTTWRRFQSDNWKDYERAGIRNVISGFISEYTEDTENIENTEDTQKNI